MTTTYILSQELKQLTKHIVEQENENNKLFVDMNARLDEITEALQGLENFMISKFPELQQLDESKSLEELGNQYNKEIVRDPFSHLETIPEEKHEILSQEEQSKKWKEMVQSFRK